MDTCQPNYLEIESFETLSRNDERSMNEYRKEGMYTHEENRNTRIVEHLMNSFEEKTSVINQTNCSIRKPNPFVKIEKTYKMNASTNKRNSVSSGRESTKDGTSEGSILLDSYNHSIKENDPLKDSFHESKNQMNFKCDTISTFCPSTSFETAAYSESVRNINKLETKNTEGAIDNLLNTQIDGTSQSRIENKYDIQKMNTEYLIHFYDIDHSIKPKDNYDTIEDNCFSIHPTSENLSAQETCTEEMPREEEGRDTEEEWSSTEKKKLLDKLMIEVNKAKKGRKNVKKQAKKKKRKGRIYKVKVRGKICWRAEWYIENKDILKESDDLYNKRNKIQTENCKNKDIQVKKESKEQSEETDKNKMKACPRYIKKSKQFSESVYGYHNARFFSLFELIKHQAVPNSLIEEANMCILEFKKNVSDNEQGKIKEQYSHIMEYLASSSANIEESECKSSLEIIDSLSQDENKNTSLVNENQSQKNIKQSILDKSLHNNMYTNYNEKLSEKKIKTPHYLSDIYEGTINNMYMNYDDNYPYVKDMNRTNRNHRESQNNHPFFETSISANDQLIKHAYNSYMQNALHNKENTLLQKQENALENSQTGLGKQEVSFDTNHSNANQEDTTNYIKNDKNFNNMIYRNYAFRDNVPPTKQTPNRINSFGTSKYFGNDWGNLNDLRNFHFMYNQNNDNTVVNNINNMNYLNCANPLNMLEKNFQKSLNNNSMHHRVNTYFPFNSFENMEKTNNSLQPMIYNPSLNNHYRNMYAQEAAAQSGEHFANQSYAYNDIEDYSNYNNLNLNQSMLPFTNIPNQNDMIPMNKRSNNNAHFTNEFIHKNIIPFNKNSLEQTFIREEPSQDSLTYPYFM